MTSDEAWVYAISLSDEAEWVHQVPVNHVCRTCQKNFSSMVAADQHWLQCSATSSTPNQHVCATCYNTFGTAGALSQHSAAVHATPVQKWRCTHPACSSKFREYTAAGLAQHMQSHTGAGACCTCENSDEESDASDDSMQRAWKREANK